MSESIFEPIFRQMCDKLLSHVRWLTEQFASSLQDWLDDLLSRPIPDNWREELARFSERSYADGIEITPQGIASLERMIEWYVARQRAPRVGSARVSAPRAVARLAAPANKAAAQETPVQQAPPPARKPSVNSKPREAFFDEKLAAAQAQLDQLARLLQMLGGKLDAAKIDEQVVVEPEVDQVEELIWRYNDQLESARDIWLRDDLPGEANARLLAMSTPASFGLPTFTDDDQRARAHRQEMEISRRLRQRDIVMDRVESGATAIERAGTAAGLMIGGGMLLKVAKEGGLWAATKALAAGLAVAGAEYGAEYGLSAAGASEQTIRGVRLAAAVIAFVLLRRKLRSTEKPPNAPDVSPSQKSTGTRSRPSSSVPRRPVSQKVPSNLSPMPATGANRGIWDLGPVTRGEIIHERLGQNLPRTFPVIDKFLNGIVTSIKSIDLRAKSYQNPSTIERVGKGFIDKVAAFMNGRRPEIAIGPSDIKGRALDIAIPPGATPQQKGVLDLLKQYGQTMLVEVHIVEIE